MSRIPGAIFFMTLTLSLPASAAASAALSGRVVDDHGSALSGARIQLINRGTGYSQAARSDAQGRFAFQNVPFNDYHLEVFAQGMAGLHREVELRTSLPMVLTLPLQPQGAVVAVEETLSLVEAHPSSHLDIDRSAIEHLATAVQSRALESILLSTPGFIADENGRFHFRGSHGQATYVIDGIPVSDQMQATFSNSLDPAQVESLEIITGGISAEYGGKPVAVINMTTKTGLATPGGFAGEVSLGLSRFNTREVGANLRGGTEGFGYFVSGAASESNRFLDPVNFQNLHNHGGTGRLYSRFDWVLTDQDVLRASLSGGRTRHEVVNLASQEAAGMDQRATTTDFNANVGWTHTFKADLSLDAALFQRRATSNLDPTQDLVEGFGAGGPDTPVWVRQHRSLENWGAQVSLNRRFGSGSTLKAGLQYVAYPIQEQFQFAFTSDGQVAGSDPLYAYSPAGGGHIFAFEDRIKPVLASAYLQSDLHLGAWFLALGLRYDHYSMREVDKGQLQPRLGVSYDFKTGTILRASFDRLLITRENENLALATSQRAWDLGPFAGTPVPPLLPELQNSCSLGLEQQLGPRGRFMIEYWAKDSWNAGDNAQFLNTGILFPISAAKGTFRGFNARFDLMPVQGFSGYLSAGRTRAVFQAPVTGGLQLEAAEAAPGTRFLIDHDQKLSAQVALRYEHRGWFTQIQGRYDSGLVAGNPGDAAGNPDLEFGTRYVRQDSEGTWRVKPRTTWNLNLGQEFALARSRKVSVGADLLNAFNQKGLYNFLSTFGGTHVTPPRTWAIHVKYTL